jgi:hypothetical protein
MGFYYFIGTTRDFGGQKLGEPEVREARGVNFVGRTLRKSGNAGLLVATFLVFERCGHVVKPCIRS